MFDHFTLHQPRVGSLTPTDQDKNEDDLLCYIPVNGEGVGGVLKLMAVCIMWGGSCTTVNAQNGYWEQWGSVFLVCTGGEAELAFFLQCGGVAARLWLRRVVLEPAFEEGWRRYQQLQPC